jgi:hypothetical protein
MAKPQYSKPASQVDLEERLSDDYVPVGQLNQGTDPGLSDNGFVGVDPIYQNFANETEKPFKAEKGPEAKIEKDVFTDDVDFDAGATAEGESEVDAEEEKEEEASKTPSGSGSSGTGSSGSGSTPPPSGGSTPPSSQS